MIETSHSRADEELAERFGEHLRSRTSQAARDLAAVLERSGRHRLAELLTRFADSRPGRVAADWWAPKATCHVGLDLPTTVTMGDLWFDPLEVSCAVVVPMPDNMTAQTLATQDQFTWLSLHPVTAWQQQGAHHVAVEIPPDGTAMTPWEALRYCELFGKVTSGSLDWMLVKQAYGMTRVEQLWGRPHEELGSAAAISGEMELLNLDGLHAWDPQDPGEPATTSEAARRPHLTYRSAAFVQAGLQIGPNTVDRIWSR